MSRMNRFALILVSILICVVTGSKISARSATSRRLGPDNLEWSNQLVNSKLFIDVGESRSKGFDMGFDTPIKVPTNCTLPTGQMGKCRSLQQCQKAHFLKSFRTFMLFHCIVGESIGVCCDNEPVLTATKRLTPVPMPPSNISVAPKPTVKPLKSNEPKPNPSSPTSQASSRPPKTAQSQPKVPVATPAALKPVTNSRIVNRPNVQKVPVRASNNGRVNIFIVLPESNPEVHLNVTKSTRQ